MVVPLCFEVRTESFSEHAHFIFLENGQPVNGNSFLFNERSEHLLSICRKLHLGSLVV